MNNISFTIESMSLKILVFSGKKIESWYSIPLNPNLVKEGQITMPEGVGAVMAEAVEENSLPVKGVVAAIPGTDCAGQVLSLPGVKKGKVHEAVRREIKRTMPSTQDIDFVYWMPMTGEGTVKGQIYTLAVSKSSVINVVDVCRAGGMKMKGIELRPFALARAVDCTSGIIVHGETDSIEIVVVDRSFPAMFRCIPVRDASFGVDGASQNLVRELPFTIDYYERTYRDSQLNPEAPIYLSGELSQVSALVEEIKRTSEREVLIAEPPVECPPDFPLAQFLTNVGLMLRAKW